MRNQLDDCQRARHILDSIQEIEAYVAGIDFDNFQSNSLIRGATERQLTIIGEAVNALTDTVRTKYTTINWRGIKGFRNIIIHEYFGVSVKMVWLVVVKELPILKKVIQQIIADCD